MAYFLQQLVNGIALGSIYGLIAIGYTMVYGIVGMINFAHGDIFMVGAFIALIAFLLIMSLGVTLIPLALVLVLIIAMLLTAMWGWTVERIAYRPLRESFRLAPLITAIGMSIILQNFIQVAQGARVKPLQPVITGGYQIFDEGGFAVNLSNIQILIVVTTVALMGVFWLIIARTALGRAQRACEQDRLMAALSGVNVDRTISLTFVIGACTRRRGRSPLSPLLRRDRFLHRLRRRHQGVHRGGVRRHRLAAWRHARRPRHRPDRDLLVGLFHHRIQGRRCLLDARHRAHLLPVGAARPS